MHAIRAIAVTALMLAAASPAAAGQSALEVLGVVTNAARPVGDALVIALNLHDLGTAQTTTGIDGRFSLPALRSGMYRIIAVKQGFVPAMTTIVPTHSTQRVNLKLESEKHSTPSAEDIWEIRASLPPDIHRKIDSILAASEAMPEAVTPRFRGEMMSMTGVAGSAASPAFARTELGVEGRLAGDWQVGVRGDLQRFEDPNDRIAFGAPIAESSVMSMELSSPQDQQTVRVASTKSSWLYASPDEGEREIDVRAHNIEWRKGPATVAVRYFQQANLFQQSPLDSNLIEISGSVPILQTGRTGLGIGLRVTQETVETNQTPFRRADVTAEGTVTVVPSVVLHYGMASRIGIEGQEWAPSTGAEWKLGEHAALVGSAMLKAVDRDLPVASLPTIVFWSEDSRMLPRYAYSVGFVSSSAAGTQFSAVASVAEMDEPLRMIFADGQTQFWDGLLVETGDVRRDVRVAWRKDFGRKFAIDVATTAGSATPSDPASAEREKVYLAGDVQSTFRPTGTTLAVSYREIQQPQEGAKDEYRSERIRLRMAQSLYLPIDIKLLLGLEVARAENSPYLVDTVDLQGKSRKYIGGLAVNF